MPESNNPKAQTPSASLTKPPKPAAIPGNAPHQRPRRPEWTQKYGEFIEATYTGQRLLDRKTKELLQICVETALRADQEQIQAHIRVALNEGASPAKSWKRCRPSSPPWAPSPSAAASRPGPPKPAFNTNPANCAGMPRCVQ